jgi:hypothetical protein
MPKRALILLLSALVAATAALSALPASASAAKTPCWKELINDWYDGRVDKTYPARCYREAQERVPEDAEIYSSLPEDLERGLASAFVGGAGPGPGPNTPIPPLEGIGRRPPAPAERAEAFGNDDKSGLLDYLAPANADSIPIPLLVLAGLAVLLLLAAIGSFLARRRQLRRVPAPAASRSPRP